MALACEQEPSMSTYRITAVRACRNALMVDNIFFIFNSFICKGKFK